MAWVDAMNNIRHSAEEFVLKDFVYSMEVRKWAFLMNYIMETSIQMKTETEDLFLMKKL